MNLCVFVYVCWTRTIEKLNKESDLMNVQVAIKKIIIFVQKLSRRRDRPVLKIHTERRCEKTKQVKAKKEHCEPELAERAKPVSFDSI